MRVRQHLSELRLINLLLISGCFRPVGMSLRDKTQDLLRLLGAGSPSPHVFLGLVGGLRLCLLSVLELELEAVSTSGP